MIEIHALNFFNDEDQFKLYDTDLSYKKYFKYILVIYIIGFMLIR